MNIRSDMAKTETQGSVDLTPFYRRANSCGLPRAVSPSVARKNALQSSDFPKADGQPPALHRLLEARLSAREPAAGYRHLEGSEQWALELYLPTEDGLIAVQIPALSDTFKGIPELYAQLMPSDDPPEQQDAALCSGFSSYDIFSALAVGQEFAIRNQLSGISRPARMRALYGISGALDRAMCERTALLRSFEALQLIPNNMRIVASRLEPAGGPISAIAENYKTSSAAISQRIASFISGPESLCEQLAQKVIRVLLLLAIRRLLSEVRMDEDLSMAAEDPDAALQAESWKDECRLLEETERTLLQRARLTMTEAEECASRFDRVSADIRRHMLGLDTIRVLGRVECSRLHDANGLVATIDQLDAFHADIRERLEAIIRHAETVGEAISEFQRSEDIL